MKGIIILLLSLIAQGSCSCFFPYEYQGIYETQVLDGDKANSPTYKELTLVPDGIVPLGVCHWKYENMAVLYDTSHGYDCMRCFHIHLRTENIMQLYTEQTNQCYPNIEEAIRSCVTLLDIEMRRATEFTLYKVYNFGGIVPKPMCPFVGKLDASYTRFREDAENNHCLHIDDEDSTCLETHFMKFNFSDCTFGTEPQDWECIGSWKGSDKNNYLAVKDLNANFTGAPKYRCAMYHVSQAGRVSLSLSSDSTCQGGLKSPWQGDETIMISKAQPPSLPAGVYQNCRFPEWAQGKWQDLDISGGKLILRNSTSKNEFDSMCLRTFGKQTNKFILFSRDQCDEEFFTCIWMRQRSTNVLEYKISPLKKRLSVFKLCSAETFNKEEWQTMGKDERSVFTCPVSGEHVGQLPDNPNLCARLASDCTSPHKMVYQVFPCKNRTVPYEERRYQCLGGWDESGVRFTYTWREDVKRYECFAGVQASADEIYIAEAGSSCQRSLQPLRMGMKMVRKGSCTTWEETLLEVGANLIQFIPFRIRSSNKFPRMTQYENAALRSGSSSPTYPALSFVSLVILLFSYWS